MDLPRSITRSDPISAATVAVDASPVAMSVPMQRRFTAGPSMGAVRG